MYFITKKTSDTGLKFSVCAKKLIMVRKAQKTISKEIGFTQCRNAYFVADGGFSSVLFDKTPDIKLWKNVNGNEWMPRANTKEGKALMGKLRSAPTVSGMEINKCIGYTEKVFNTIGFAFNSKEYFGFIVDDKWKVKIPKDCEEVTFTRYREIFK